MYTCTRLHTLVGSVYIMAVLRWLLEQMYRLMWFFYDFFYRPNGNVTQPGQNTHKTTLIFSHAENLFKDETQKLSYLNMFEGEKVRSLTAYIHMEHGTDSIMIWDFYNWCFTESKSKIKKEDWKTPSDTDCRHSSDMRKKWPNKVNM